MEPKTINIELMSGITKEACLIKRAFFMRSHRQYLVGETEICLGGGDEKNDAARIKAILDRRNEDERIETP